jgi:hypothetical protein
MSIHPREILAQHRHRMLVNSQARMSKMWFDAQVRSPRRKITTPQAAPCKHLSLEFDWGGLLIPRSQKAKFNFLPVQHHPI